MHVSLSKYTNLGAFGARNQKSQLSQLLNHIMCWPKSCTHPADDDNNRNDRSISHPGCTCGGDGIWVHGTGCLTCTKLRGPEDLLVFSSTQNSDTGTHDAQIAPYLACGSICFARTLHISFLNQTSSTSAPYFTTKWRRRRPKYSKMYQK